MFRYVPSETGRVGEDVLGIPPIAAGIVATSRPVRLLMMWIRGPYWAENHRARPVGADAHAVYVSAGIYPRNLCRVEGTSDESSGAGHARSSCA